MCIRKIEKALVEQFWTQKMGLFPFYTIKEIYKLTGGDYCNTRKAIKKAVELGLLVENRLVPTKPTYRINQDYYKKYYTTK